jgi:hypothetical protein
VRTGRAANQKVVDDRIRIVDDLSFFNGTMSRRRSLK